MEASFWHRRWQDLKIDFHQSEANPFLVKFFDRLELPAGSRIFVPLCGKTLDISWLLGQGYRVVGVELSELAVEQLFAQLEMKPRVSQASGLQHHAAEGVDIFAGDFFQLTSEVLGPVDAVFDRAALVALPEDMRSRYTAHLMQVTDLAPQLLLTYEYDQSQAPGPPFSVPENEVLRHYSENYGIDLVTSHSLPDSSRGSGTRERLWQLTRPVSS